MSVATSTPKTYRKLLPVDLDFAIMLAVKALCQSSLSPVVLHFTDVRGSLHEGHVAEICFNLTMSKTSPLRFLAISWTGVMMGIWWITAFVGLPDFM